MKSFISFFVLYFLLLIASAAFAQENKVVITGARFTYPLVNEWIAKYKEVNPSVEVVIDPRTTQDPDQYDLLIEAYELDAELAEKREFLHFARYALIPVANAKSQFARIYGDKGLTNDLLKQVYFADIFADRDKQQKIKAPFTVYTRLQKSGAATSFARFFGYEQHNIQGKAIAGADEHLLKAILKDSTGITYSHPSQLYDLTTRQLLPGYTILPVDLDDNGRVSGDEKFYSSLDEVILKLESANTKNLPVQDLHLSLAKRGYKTEALKFLLWVIEHGQDDLHAFGFLKPTQKKFDDAKQVFQHLTRR